MDIQEINQSSPEFLYQMLGRLEADCLYYLGNGGRFAGHLWGKRMEVLTVTKYYISLEADGNFHIIEYDIGEGVRVLRDAGGRETSVVIYHNSLIISALYDTVEAAIKHLGGSRRETILPDGRVVIPESVNYPELVISNIFVPFSAVRAEVWPGEPGWRK